MCIDCGRGGWGGGGGGGYNRSSILWINSPLTLSLQAENTNIILYDFGCWVFSIFLLLSGIALDVGSSKNQGIIEIISPNLWNGVDQMIGHSLFYVYYKLDVLLLLHCDSIYYFVDWICFSKFFQKYNCIASHDNQINVLQ